MGGGGITISTTINVGNINQVEKVRYRATEFRTELMTIMSKYPMYPKRYLRVRRTDTKGGFLAIAEIKIYVLPKL